MAENIFHQNRFINLCIATLTLLISKKQDKRYFTIKGNAA